MGGLYNRTPLVEMLLAKGSDPNAVNKVGGTPLMVAAAKGNAEIARLLLERGAKTELKDKQGKTARQWALDSRKAGSGRVAQK
jgi:ankyrin repeat protein